MNTVNFGMTGNSAGSGSGLLCACICFCNCVTCMCNLCIIMEENPKALDFLREYTIS